jgi:chromosome segregation ATPase
MAKNKSNDFNFDDIRDEDYEGELYRQEMKDLRIEKINQRVTIITILIPCLIGIVLYIAYRDITGRVSESEFTGSKEVKALSEKLEKKFSEFENQNATFQTSLNAKIESIQKTTSNLNSDLKKIGESVIKLEKDMNRTQAALKNIKTSKVDRKEQATAIKKVNNTLGKMRIDIEALAPLGKDVNSLSSKIGTLSSEIKTIDKKVTSEMTAVTESLKLANSDVKKIQAGLANQTEDQLKRIDVKLDMLLLKIKINYENAIKQAVEGIEKDLEELQKRTKQLEGDAQQLDPSASNTSKAKPPSQTKSTEIGGIKEQDIE